MSRYSRNDVAAELGIRLVLTFVIGTLIIAGFAMAHSHIAYWLAYLIAAGVVFLGEFIVEGDWTD